MTELIPGSVDASHEKHVPVITVDGNNVTVEVGAVAHPMTEEHYIEWIYLETTNGGQRKALKPGEAPEGHLRADRRQTRVRLRLLQPARAVEKNRLIIRFTSIHIEGAVAPG